MPKIKHDRLASHLPDAVAKLVLFITYVIEMMTKNSNWFPTPTPSLMTVKEHLDALVAAETQARNRTKGAADVRDKALKLVIDDALQLQSYAQSIINANPNDAVIIATASGMSLRQLTRYEKPELQAQMTATPGVVLVRGKAVKKRPAWYEWQCSTDGGETWVTIDRTTVAHCTLSGVTVGTKYLFRFRSTVRQKTGDWSMTLSYIAR